MKRTVTKIYECKAPKELFAEDWDTVPQKLKDKIPEGKGLGCDGGGVPGTWCHGTIIDCHWAAKPVIEVDIVKE